jgi:hypothetical protein
MPVQRFREVGVDRRDEFVANGLKSSSFFPHTWRVLPKCGPDAFKIATRIFGDVDPDGLWEVVLYASSPALDEFPDELFFDDDLVWHQQQFGLRGQIASANVLIADDALYSMVHLSDAVQRVGRRRAFKTRMENRFRGWASMLLNAILHFGAERNVSVVRTPTAALALHHTDPKRHPGAELFERVYDRSVQLLGAQRRGDWWEMTPRPLASAATRCTSVASRKTVAICHDTERGLGHPSEPLFAREADRRFQSTLTGMLEIERRAGVRTTYAVVGEIMDESREAIARGGHALAFHSYDHREGEQLSRCRSVDYRLKGYRVPQSNLTPELREERLLFHNFEWLASSRWSYGFAAPRMERRLVKIPISFDDFALHEGKLSWEEWRSMAIRHVEQRDYTAIGLHDCYAPHWMEQYARFLDELQSRAELVTLDEVAARVTLESAC